MNRSVLPAAAVLAIVAGCGTFGTPPGRILQQTEVETGTTTYCGGRELRYATYDELLEGQPQRRATYAYDIGTWALRDLQARNLSWQDLEAARARYETYCGRGVSECIANLEQAYCPRSEDRSAPPLAEFYTPPDDDDYTPPDPDADPPPPEDFPDGCAGGGFLC